MGPLKLGWTWEVIDFDPARGMSNRTISKSALGVVGLRQPTPNGVVPYIRPTDFDTTLAKVEEAGGEVLIPKTDVQG